MHQKSIVLCSAAAVLALAIACSKGSETPVSPSVSEGGAGDALADGVTLKATAAGNAPAEQPPYAGPVKESAESVIDSDE